MPNYERTGWRDKDISERHHRWGWDCPGTDLDFVFLEFNHGLAVAVVDYKYSIAMETNGDAARFRAMDDLATNHVPPLPFFLAYYWKTPWRFRIVPMNDAAKLVFAPSELLSERAYVERLYAMRGLRAQAKILELLDAIETEPVEADIPF